MTARRHSVELPRRCLGGVLRWLVKHLDRLSQRIDQLERRVAGTSQVAGANLGVDQATIALADGSRCQLCGHHAGGEAEPGYEIKVDHGRGIGWVEYKPGYFDRVAQNAALLNIGYCAQAQALNLRKKPEDVE